MTKHFSSCVGAHTPYNIQFCLRLVLGLLLVQGVPEDDITFSQVVISLLPLALSPAASAIYNASLCEGLSSRNGNNLIIASMPRLPPRLLVSGGGLSASLPASHLCSSPQAPSNRPASFKILILPPLTLAVFSSLVQNIDFEAINISTMFCPWPLALVASKAQLWGMTLAIESGLAAPI